MNILREYTLDYIKRNKKSSLTVMVALLMATILMNSFCLYTYNMWTDEIRITIKKMGNWHGELFDGTKGEALDYIKAYASVDKVLVKRKWYVAEVGDKKRPYLIMRDANKAYWENMSEQYTITEGHMPKQTGEIAVSKQFMLAHPEYKVGDTLTLPVGDRVSAGKIISPQDIGQKGEVFRKQGEATYKIVAVLDVTTSSKVPGYTGIGYLDEQMIKPNDDLTVYLQFKNIQDTYKELPKIAQKLGYQKDEYGNYLLRYNERLLLKYGVFPKIKQSFSIYNYAFPITMAIVIIALSAVFIFIIHNAFEVSMQSRKKQLGMLKSIGATPRQIRESITFEALILAVIPIPIGLVISNVLWKSFLEQINQVNSAFGMEPFQINVSIFVELGVVAVTLAIAWMSAYIPSRKLSKMMPVQILKGDLSSLQLKNKRQSKKLGRLVARIKNREQKMVKRRDQKTQEIYIELATNHFKAHKKAFRVSTISLTLSLALLMVFLTCMASGNLSNAIYYKESKHNISLSIEDGNPIDEEVQEGIETIPQIQSYKEFSQSTGTTWITAEDESLELKAAGGLKKIATQNKHYIYLKGNQYRIRTRLVGLDDKTFKAYCDQVGTDWKKYYDKEHIYTIVYNQTHDTTQMTKRYQKEIPLLKLKEEDKIRVNEKVYDDDIGQYEFNTWAGKVTNQMPDLDISRNDYTLMEFMPMSIFQEIVSHFDSEKAIRDMKITVHVQAEEQAIQSVSDELAKLCDKVYGLGDYSIWNRLDHEKADKAADQITNLIIYFLATLFAVIGITNAFSTVYTSLEQRSRSFAILRSIGISKNGINKLLVLEALHFIKKPVIYAVGIEIILVAFMIYMNESSVSEFLPFLPIGGFIGFIVAVIASIGLAYLVGSRKIRTQNITQVIQDETL